VKCELMCTDKDSYGYKGKDENSTYRQFIAFCKPIYWTLVSCVNKW